jgi:DnaJ-class molecular chaperone
MPEEAEDCSTCKGSGEITVSVVDENGNKTGSEDKTCPVCNGSGKKSS